MEGSGSVRRKARYEIYSKGIGSISFRRNDAFSVRREAVEEENRASSLTGNANACTKFWSTTME